MLIKVIIRVLFMFQVGIKSMIRGLHSVCVSLLLRLDRDWSEM